MIKFLNKILHQFGHRISKLDPRVEVQHPDIVDKEFWELYTLCRPYTMTSVERMFGLFLAVKYVLERNVPGHFVECGVWRGGSALLMARMLQNRGITDRHIYLYDTFEGMPPPTKNDVSYDGEAAAVQLERNVQNKEESVWCYANLDDVQRNVGLSNFAENNIHYVAGKVEETIPGTLPGNIALLRLDTDWYESTKHEMTHLYPLLEKDGILIIDDYGHWEGCRKAVDEYLSLHNIHLLLSRLDYTGRIAIKA